MTASELYSAGKLDEAIAAQTEEVKKKPTDADARGFLVELLCFRGDLDRADKQLEALATQAPEAMIGVALLRHLVRAEQWRRQCFGEGRAPELLGTPPDHLQLHLKASIAVREGDLAEAARLLTEAEAARPRLAGTADDTPFGDFRDLDDMTASFFEVLTSNGKYYWVAFDGVQQAEFHAPERPRDLFWRRVSLTVREGPEGDVYVPSIYAPIGAGGDSGGETTESLQLGRATDWLGGGDTPVRGRGQRTFLVGDDTRTILELNRLTFEAAS